MVTTGMRFRFRRIDVMLSAVVVVSVVALQFVFTVSGSDEQKEREEEEEEWETREGSSSPPPPLTLQPDVKPWSDRGSSRSHLGLKSKACQSRGKCSGDGTDEGHRNCFCDRLCSYYDDCCRDYRPEDGGGGDQFAHLPRGVAACQRVNDVETGNSVEAFKVSRCPKSFADDDDDIRRLCEAEVGPATSDRFLLLPVTGNASLVLYRNIYCAACAGERHPVFWLAKLRCGRGQLVDSGSGRGKGIDLRAIMRAACPVDFAPVREWGGGPGGPRRCTVHIGRCDRDWTDERVRQKCRSATNYVFAGNRAFRNKHCALCNYVNETYLRCDDVRPQSKADVTSGGYLEDTAASVVTLDFNRGLAVVMETVPGRDYVAERRVDFPACSPGGGVYDPFADVCRNVTCLPEMVFSGENCFRQPETAAQNDGAAEESVTSNDDDDDDEGHAQEEQDKDNDVKISHRGGDIFNSTAVAMVTTLGVAMTTTTVETDFVPMSARFVLFRMDSLQRLMALLGTLLCVLFLCVFVVLFVVYESMRTDPANRYAVCLSLCLLVAHLLFVFVVLPTEHFLGPLPCFCLSIVIQYAYITAFFWLNVLSIDAFKRLTVDRPTADQPTAFNHCACFTLFSLLAWVVPAVPMAASTAIAVLRVDGWEQLYGGGAEGCFVMGMSQLLLFLVPVAIVVTTNFAMYVIVTCRICLEPQPMGADKERFRQTLKDRKLFVTCVQLTVVMTTTWALAFVAHLTGLTFVWNLFILFDTMQGLSVAAAFAFKVKVWRQFNGGSRSVTITKTPEKIRNRSSSSDGVDTAIEPFVDVLPEEGVESPVVPSNASQDAVFRETSI